VLHPLTVCALFQNYMSDSAFSKRLAELKARWDESTTKPESMTVEAKKQCLEELDEVCKSLGIMKEGLMKASEVEEKIEIAEIIKCSTARLAQINCEMRGIGVVYPVSNHTCLFGKLPSNWIDRDEYLIKIESTTKEIKKLETDLAVWQPALIVARKDHAGNAIEWLAVIPPPTDFLKGVYERFRNDQAYFYEVRGKVEGLTQEILRNRGMLRKYLSNYKPIDRKKLQAEVDSLNAEKERLVYDLRVFECKGHAVDFGSCI
jgi:hypothetical protein